MRQLLSLRNVFRVRINSQVAKDCGRQVSGRNRFVNDVSRMAIRRAIDVPGRNATTCEQRSKCVRPMVAPRLARIGTLCELSESRRAAGLSNGDDQSCLQETALIKVMQKRRKGLIENGAQKILQLRKIVLVCIPTRIRTVDFRFIFPVDGHQ